jgi:hypothetical protein
MRETFLAQFLEFLLLYGILRRLPVASAWIHARADESTPITAPEARGLWRRRHSRSVLRRVWHAAREKKGTGAVLAVLNAPLECGGKCAEDEARLFAREREGMMTRKTRVVDVLGGDIDTGGEQLRQRTYFPAPKKSKVCRQGREQVGGGDDGLGQKIAQKGKIHT